MLAIFKSFKSHVTCWIGGVSLRISVLLGHLLGSRAGWGGRVCEPCPKSRQAKLTHTRVQLQEAEALKGSIDGQSGKPSDVRCSLYLYSCFSARQGMRIGMTPMNHCGLLQGIPRSVPSFPSQHQQVIAGLVIC